MSILLGVRRIDDLLQRLPDGDAWLGAQERERLARITHPQRRAQYRAGHGYVRELLACCGGGDVLAWSLARDEHGAPLALCEGVSSSLQVSLSHSAGFVACAVGTVRVGVDIECPLRERDLLALAGSLYPLEFLRALEGCDADARRAMFFRRWTLDEAHGKADGRGIGLHALREQAWRPVPHGRVDGWTWDVPGGWLAVAVCGDAGRQEIAFDGDVAVAAMRAWRREVYSTSRIE